MIYLGVDTTRYVGGFLDNLGNDQCVMCLDTALQGASYLHQPEVPRGRGRRHDDRNLDVQQLG